VQVFVGQVAYGNILSVMCLMEKWCAMYACSIRKEAYITLVRMLAMFALCLL
jgi:hypothetical protein